MYHSIYTRHTSSCMNCDCVRSPQSLTYVSSW
ncbi:methionine aminopeptidase, partial [Escherichia coli]|nr:methionine aminopeptidase [Escherichia coli]EFN9551949.1 methionine aminopeptidase [Escherichia coli]EGD4724132.1 methionine aminopeptidase [Escherichia coli]EGD4770920.1 methionine aminopeptidase [Escherichia coli]EGD5018377.1 methionine aminopeptidase [Escherichia coli]